MSTFRSALRQAVGEWCPLDEAQLASLERHFELLVVWNKRLNLTRVIELPEAVWKHYAESLFLARTLAEGEFRAVDVGAGAGFPGFPVAVSRPDCSVTLVESHQRKAVFLRESARAIPNIRVEAVRAEALPRNSFDVVVSRAVRWEDVLQAGLATRVSLLMAASDASEMRKTAGFRWNDPVSLPWDPESVVQGGEVSRGT